MKKFILTILLLLLFFSAPADATQAVRMTYAASGSSGITVADNDNIDFGTRNFTLRWKGALPDWTPTGNTYLLYKLVGTCAYGLGAMANGTFRLYAGNNHGGIVYKDSNTHSLVDGTSHEIVAVVVAPTASVAGSVTFYVDGSIFGTSITVTATSDWTASDNSGLYICGTNNARQASANNSVTLYNRALSAAEVLSLFTSGVASADQYGSQTAKYTSDFSVNANGWSPTRGAVAGNTDGIGGEDDWLRYTVDANVGSHSFKKTTILTPGKRFRVTLKYYIPSTNSNLDGFEIRDDEGYSVTASGTYNTLDSATTITFDCAIPLQGTSTGISIYTKDGTEINYQDAGGNDVIYIKTVSVYQIGATLDLEPSGIGATNVYTSNYSAGADSMQSSGGTGAGNVDGILGQDDTFKYYADGTTTSHVLTRNMLTLGKIYRVNFDYYIPSANTNVKKIRVRPGNRTTDRNGNSVYGTVTGQWANITAELATTSGSDNYLEIDIMNNADSVNYTGANSSSDDILYIKNLKVDDMSWQDSSSNNLDGTMPDVGWNILNMGPFMSTPTLFRPIWNKPVWRYISAP